MKTPDEIKKGLECCFNNGSTERCNSCPYDKRNKNYSCVDTMLRDVIDLVRQLERERDAAVKTLKEIGDCKYCKHNAYCTTRFPNCVECEKTDCACHTCAYRSNWEWRGVQE